jgi:hypothetical protein
MKLDRMHTSLLDILAWLLHLAKTQRVLVLETVLCNFVTNRGCERKAQRSLGTHAREQVIQSTKSDMKYGFLRMMCPR